MEKNEAISLDIFRSDKTEVSPYFRSDNGILFDGDCMDVLPLLKDDLFDTIFADPPFNLGKKYGKKANDSKSEAEYVEWCRKWTAECARILKPGGAFFIYNLPKWNFLLGSYLMQDLNLQFRHSIAVEMKNCLPIQGRLYPAHYSLLYLTKGKPKTFKKIRTPIELCRHCGGEVKDYGGHRHAMNPAGVNLKDIWTDIPPVRHWKFKSKKRLANALSTKVLDRVVEMTTNPGELVLDPFGGSGTTFAVCDRRNRQWVGIELDFCEAIVERVTSNDIQHHRNGDTVEEPDVEIRDWPDAAE